MWSMMKRILESGHWKQCLFCRQAQPTREWSNKLYATNGHVCEGDVIEPSGYCTYCEKKGLRV